MLTRFYGSFRARLGANDDTKKKKLLQDSRLGRLRKLAAGIRTVAPSGLDTVVVLRSVRARFMPVKVVMRVDEASRPRLSALHPFLRSVKPRGGKPTAYVCERFTCQLPVTDREALAAQLVGDTVEG